MLFYHCYARTGLGPLVPLKANHNATAYKNVQGSFALPTVVATDVECPKMGVMVGCPNTFGHIVHVAFVNMVRLIIYLEVSLCPLQF